MSKARVAVLKVISKELSVTAAAAEYGYSRQHLHRLLARYRPRASRRSSRAHGDPRRTRAPPPSRCGADRRATTAADQGTASTPGPVTIAWHLEQEGHRPPSTSTIRRILHAAGLVTPEPRKRPRSSYRRFAAAQPNECWQSDFTHWRLADGTDVEILNWLDDHSRYLLGATAHAPVTGEIVTTSFLAIADDHGLPPSTLTDNGRVYTARFGGGSNGFEYLLAVLGITQKNGHPGHPQTQGKIERFHQTLKRWLAQQPPPPPWPNCKHQLDSFRALQPPTTPPRARPAHPRRRLRGPTQGRTHPATATPATTGCATTASTPSAR